MRKLRKIWINSFVIGLMLLFCTRQTQAESNWVKTNLATPFVTSIETTPWGIAVGEQDTRLWLNPPNDIYLSNDLGQTWITLGLSGRGIKDLKYYYGKLYAATYYVKNGTLGFFVSEGPGKPWIKIGPSFSPTKIERDSQTIYFGGQNNGLWISQDNGLTWSQKIGDGWYGPEIKEIFATEKIALVSTVDKVYQSLDHGLTWTEVNALSNKTIGNFTANGDMIFAGSTANQGLYKSTDLGLTWQKVTSLGNVSVGGLLYTRGTLYAGKINPQATFYSVFYSYDFGNTWIDTNLNTFINNYLLTSGWGFAGEPYLFTFVLNSGLYKYQIPKKELASNPFLSTPWSGYKPYDFVDKITAYFDHEYPLLGYSYFKEPKEINLTTINFLNMKGSEPNMYYSSHNGTDYALTYGTQVKAASGGIASRYFCNACGNSIKIDHPDGYQTVYMHLQKNGLIADSQNISVIEGDTLGYVGMTGNTNGPHLHFEVIANNKYPDGLLDPYGWADSDGIDPWPAFFWTDSLGAHQGSFSNYLWKIPYPQISTFLSGSGSVTLDNKTVTTYGSENNLTLDLKNYSIPVISKVQDYLTYIPNTSIIITAYNFLGEKVTQLTQPAEINIHFEPPDLQNVLVESLKIFYLNPITKLWEPLHTVLDLIQNKLSAQTDHFSQFAVLGYKVDSSPPETNLLVTGSLENGWFKNYPIISLEITETSDSSTKSFYTLSGEEGWEEYTEPVTLNKEGVSVLEYRSLDESGNLENTQSFVFPVDLENRFKKTVTVKNATFTTE